MNDFDRAFGSNVDDTVGPPISFALAVSSGALIPRPPSAPDEIRLLAPQLGAEFSPMRPIKLSAALLPTVYERPTPNENKELQDLEHEMMRQHVPTPLGVDETA